MIRGDRFLLTTYPIPPIHLCPCPALRRTVFPSFLLTLSSSSPHTRRGCCMMFLRPPRKDNRWVYLSIAACSCGLLSRNRICFVGAAWYNLRFLAPEAHRFPDFFHSCRYYREVNSIPYGWPAAIRDSWFVDSNSSDNSLTSLWSVDYA